MRLAAAVLAPEVRTPRAVGRCDVIPIMTWRLSTVCRELR